MDLTYIDKLAKDNNSVSYLLIRQDLFSGMKTKHSKEMVRAFLTMITKKNRTKNIWVDKRTDFAGEFK